MRRLTAARSGGSVWVTRHLECRCVQLWALGDRDEGIDPE